MGAVAKLVRTELRLFLREPLALAFVFAFPIITVLVLIGSFEEDDPAFGGVTPAHWYTAGYLAVVVAAIGMVMVPVHLATYRERGVLRRFAAAGFGRWSFAIAELIVGLVMTFIACAALLLVVGLLFGLPAVESPVPTIAGLVLGAIAFVGMGVLIGALAPSARAAQGIGMLLFFPVFLLGGGGPPPDAMSSVMRRVADVLPLTHVTRSVQDPWLDLGSSAGNLLVVAVLAAATTVAAARFVRLR